ncbi:hypothetical protein DFH06DRAFT_1331534 [Mycena polygramma]|nr:hypothetical protein DFH06DRAFT_1331534 [Mycena polygramma]
MSDILASLDVADIKISVQKHDSEGRVLAMYVDPANKPRHVLLLGVLLATSDLDDGLRVLVLGPPGPDCPITRAMFKDQHTKLDLLMGRDVNDATRLLLNRQVWCQGAPDSYAGAIYVRVSEHTTTDVNDFGAETLAQETSATPFSSFAPEVPIVDRVPQPLDIGALLICAVDMFRADIPIRERGLGQTIYDRAYGLNAAAVVRFVRSTTI